MTTVVYDHQAFAMQRYGGISRYFAELVRNLASCADMTPLIVAPFAENEYLDTLLSQRARSLRGGYRSRGVGKISAVESLLNKRAVRRAFAQHPDALYHPTYYDPFLLTPDFSAPVVITIHDMIYELFGDSLHDPQTTQRKRAMIRRADHIVAVSESTRADLIRFYPEAAEKSTVIYHGVSIAAPPDNSTPLVEGAYLLFVGSRLAYKNFAALISAFGELSRAYPDLKLVCVGGGPFSESEVARLKELGISDKVDWREVPDDALANLYAHAKAFVFPSLYEGFGLPVLEAMTCGAPCVLHRASSLPEVGGDAALYCDAARVADLQQTIARVLEDSCLQDLLRAEGRRRAAEFSWERCARQHAALYAALDASS